MKDEVEDFLRRVAQMRAQAEAQARAQQQRMAQPQAPAQPQQRMMPPARFPPPQPAQSPFAPQMAPQRQEVIYLEPADEVEVIDAEVAELGGGVGRHVSQHLRGSQQIAEHARNLGAEVDLADDKLEAHLQQTFDHKLGQLQQRAISVEATPQKASGPDVTADQILHMLRSPASIRNAFVMSEIFRRPEGME
jgi:hypothetical protein